MKIFSALLLAGLLSGLTACTKSTPHTSSATASNDAAAKLPDVAVGDFYGLLGVTESGALKRSFANARATVAAHGDRYRITFSGGTPEVPADFTVLDNLIFVVTPGSQQGIYHAVARDGSAEGITLSTYMTNLNIELTQGAGGLIYTGQK